jgi:DNA adenine methylase Dam
MNDQLKLSPFKWAGSKLKEKKKIREILGSSKISIVEPFMGTGLISGFFGKEGSCFGNDLNFDIINLYRWCNSQEFEDLSRIILTDKNMNSHDFFYQKRDEFNETEINTLNRAVLFWYLQNCAHFGLYRLNKYGKYTSTWHFFTKSAQFDARLKSIKFISSRFQNIKELDYKVFLEQSSTSVDLYFFDPPYITASYDDYSVKGGVFNHEDLKFIDDYCTFLFKRKNICSIICNYKTSNDDEIYKGSSEIRSFDGVRSLNLNDVKRINTKSSIYVLYGDFTKSYNMKEFL